MKDLLFDFTVDKANNVVHITREFAAPCALVWAAFTTQEFLDQWWAPQPLLSKTISMDFSVGGQRFYAMVQPDGQEHFGIQQFTSITPMTNLTWLSSFADKDGNINSDFPTSVWDLTFTEENGTTRVAIAIQHKTLADIEMHIRMGFKDGFTMTLDHLDQLLSAH
ncbi:MAG: SRPBCC domain-containing protein [Bacteroidetes bacterium]|nr:SRPBCC domain-containing protein [Bacteroidota bacterium]